MPRAPLPCWLLSMVVLTLIPASTRGDEIARAVKQARASLDKKDYDGAVQRLDAVITSHPELAKVAEPHGLGSWVHPQANLVDAYVARAEGLFCKQDWDRALADCSAALALQSHDPDVLIFKAVAHVHRVEFDPALAALDAALQADPGEKTLRMMRVMVDLLAGRDDQALADLDLCLKSSSLRAFAYWIRGQVHYSRGQLDLAFADMAESIHQNPRDPLGLMSRSTARMARGQLDEALRDADELVRLNPRQAGAYDYRATVATVAQRYDQAIRDGSEAIRLEPKGGMHWQIRAAAKWEQRDQAGALADIEHAVALLPGQPAPLRMQAYILASATDARLRDGPRALTLATKAQELTRVEPAHALQVLAAAQAEVGQIPQAVATATEALRLAPGDTPVGWRLKPTEGRQLLVTYCYQNQRPDTLARRIEHDLARYRAGQPNRFD